MRCAVPPYARLINLQYHANIARWCDPPSNTIFGVLQSRRPRRTGPRMLSFRCCFAMIAVFSSLLFLPFCRQRARVSAANRISVADKSLQKQQKQPASLREGCRGDMQLTEQRAGDRLPFFL
jgi:hypothetical protein